MVGPSLRSRTDAIGRVRRRTFFLESLSKPEGPCGFVKIRNAPHKEEGSLSFQLMFFNVLYIYSLFTTLLYWKLSKKWPQKYLQERSLPVTVRRPEHSKLPSVWTPTDRAAFVWPKCS